MLDDGKLICPVQLALERDIAGGVGLLGRTVQATPERIGMTAIEEVGLGLSTNHLCTEHTLRHFRASLWLPAFLDRSGWRGAESDTAALHKAQATIDALTAGYRKPQGREDKLGKLRAVVRRARARLT